MSNHEEYDDPELLQYHGLGADVALQALNTVRTHLASDGVRFTYTCECGKASAPVIEWSELACVAHKLAPNQVMQTNVQWQRQQDGSMSPAIPCPGCRTPRQLLLGHGECEGYLSRGLASGAVFHDPNWPAVAQYLNALRQRAGVPPLPVRR